MRLDVPAPVDPTLVSRDGVTVTLYPAASPRELALETAVGGVDLTPYAESASHTSTQATVPLVHEGQLVGAARPRAGQCVAIRMGGYAAFYGVIDVVSPEREVRGGNRAMTLTVRRRDALPWWRDVRRQTTIYSVGVDLASMARDVAAGLRLTPEEVVFPNLGIALAHDSTQLADMNAWDMLELILQLGLLEPYVDARGVLKAISRNIRRAAELELTAEQIAEVAPGSGRPPLTAVRVRWLDPALTKVAQQDQPLTTASLSAGFFRWESAADVYWSDDRRQRAEGTYLVKKQSINDGLLHVGREEYEQRDEYGGRVTAKIDAFLPGLAIGGLAALIAANAIPEPVQVGPTGTGSTVPWYKAAAKGAAETTMWLAVLALGYGVYEIRGVPYDYVHAVHEVEAYDEDAEPWEQRHEEIQNDLVPDAHVAQALAVNELVHRARASAGSSLTIADDLRIERGDLLGLPDGRRFWVADYSRSLARGAVPLLQLQGFFA
jgi:hypothetical protein